MSKPAAPRERRTMKTKTATVMATSWISPELIRISFQSPDFIGVDLPFTDHYIKILFPPAEADYAWPGDLSEIAEKYPRELQPSRRTYTLRSVDPESGAFDVDFVAHGDQGLAGPWAQQAKIGDVIAFGGPGGAWKPESHYEHIVLAGDEAAAPAIFAALEALPEGITAQAFVEISTDDARFDAPSHPNIEVNWVPRSGATHGTLLIDALREVSFPEKKTSWFIHGVAEMVKETRKFLFVEQNVAKEDASISGYWRLGMTEDQWQASKREFNEANEAEEKALAESSM